MHLSLPKRVSRIYPILSLILAINCSVLFYAWQTTQIKLNTYSNFAEREKSLESQISSLQASQRQDRANISIQEKKVSDATAQLETLQKNLDSKAKEVAAKEAQLKVAEDQLAKQQQQLATNASELEKLRTRPPLFSFQNNSSISDVSAKEASVKQVVSAAYDYVQQLYGTPYLLNSIVITFVDKFNIEGSAGEIVIENGAQGITINIHLKDFDNTSFQDVNTLIHEMIHGFHGVAVFDSSALEEGMTVAATDAVMKQMIDDNKLPVFDHLYLTTDAEQYKTWNSTLHVPSSNQALYDSPDVAKLYQLIGTAWYNLYLSDQDVFKKINEAYYPKVQKGISPDNGTVLDAIRASIKSVNGVPIDTYLSTNSAFNPH